MTPLQPLRLALVCGFAVALALQLPATARADDMAVISQAQQKMEAAGSFRATIHTHGHTSIIDFQLPDSFHETLDNGMQIVYVGGHAWMYQQSKWISLPMAFKKPVVDLTHRMSGSMSDYTVSYVGPKELGGGTPAKLYRVEKKSGGESFDIYVTDDGYPARIVTKDAEIDYSMFGQVKVSPPQ